MKYSGVCVFRLFIKAIKSRRVSLLMIQFKFKIQIMLIIPQWAILLWSWRARKIIHNVKRTVQQTHHHQQKGLTYKWCMCYETAQSVTLTGPV